MEKVLRAKVSEPVEKQGIAAAAVTKKKQKPSAKEWVKNTIPAEVKARENA
jgi:hypothetical protein